VLSAKPESPRGSRRHIVALCSLRELAALAPSWDALWRRVPNATPFQHPAWLVPWWQSFAHGDLWTLAAYRDDPRRDDGLPHLCAVLPLYREENGTLLPLGIGVSDWLDALAEDEGVLSHMIAELPELTGRTRVEFPSLASSSALHRMASPAGARDETWEQDACPTLSLPETVSELAAALPPRQTRNLRHCRSRAARAGAVEVRAATAVSAQPLFEELVRLHTARWAERGEPGVLGDPAVQAFHRTAVVALARAGLLRMYELRVGGRLAAVHYGLGDGRRAYYYIGGFDPALASLAPGVLMVGHAIEEAVREGAREFHFLRGREPYKYEWGAVDRPSFVRRMAWDEDTA
jgi:CelD/BcsL family acetyltransferase involved in cellulose biosynthesis